MSYPSAKIILITAHADARSFYNDCMFPQPSFIDGSLPEIVEPTESNTESADAESFHFSFNREQFTSDEQFESAKEYYLAAFWIEIEHKRSMLAV